jgi:uncharacterized damage-inducible protein DinB
MQPTDYVSLVQFNQWANNHLLDVAAKLSPEQLHAEAGLSFGSAFKTLRHVLDVGWSWRLVCEGQEASKLLWEVEPMEDFEAVRAYWGPEAQRLVDFVRSLSDGDLERVAGVPSGESKPFTVKQILLHIVTHDTGHRNELGWYFTRLGHSPGDMDYLDYVDRDDHTPSTISATTANPEIKPGSVGKPEHI